MTAGASALIAGSAARWEAAGRIPRSELAELAGTGLFGLTAGKEQGGAGLDLAAAVGVHARVAAESPGLHSIMVVHAMVCHALTRWAAPGLRSRLLPELATGARLGAFALTETGFGADIRGLTTTIEPIGDDLVVTGHKSWISNGQDADLFLVFGYDQGAGRAVVVPRGAGVETVSGRATASLRAAGPADVRFDRVRVPADLEVGRRGFGVPHVATTCLMYGRLFVAAGAVGVARAAVRLAAEHTAARVVGGTPLAERQLVRAALADASALTDGAEALLVATAAMVEQRAPDAAIAAARAKLLASRAADLATDSAGRLLGAEGCVADHPVARLLAAARAYQVIEGPTEVLQDLIGASLVRARPDGATR